MRHTSGRAVLSACAGAPMPYSTTRARHDHRGGLAAVRLAAPGGLLPLPLAVALLQRGAALTRAAVLSWNRVPWLQVA